MRSADARRIGLLLLLAAGCGFPKPPPTGDVATAGIQALFDAFADGSGSLSVTGYLIDMKGESLLLSTGDRLSVTVGTDTEVMAADLVETDTLYTLDYSAQFSNAATGVPITLDFQRQSQASAAGSTVTLPPSFTPGVASGGPFSRASQDVTIVLDIPSSPSDEVSWSIWADCGPDARGVLPGALPGPAVASAVTRFIVPKEIVQRVVGPEAGQCTVSVGVMYLRIGTFDPALEPSSRISAKQGRKVTFASVP